MNRKAKTTLIAIGMMVSITTIASSMRRREPPAEYEGATTRTEWGQTHSQPNRERFNSEQNVRLFQCWAQVQTTHDRLQSGLGANLNTVIAATWNPSRNRRAANTAETLHDRLNEDALRMYQERGALPINSGNNTTGQNLDPAPNRGGTTELPNTRDNVTRIARRALAHVIGDLINNQQRTNPRRGECQKNCRLLSGIASATVQIGAGAGATRLIARMLVPPLLGDERTRRARGIAAQLTGLSSRGRWQRARDLVQTEKYLTTILLNLEGRLAAEGMQREIDTTGLIRVQIRRAYDVLWACIILGMTTGDHMMQAFRNLNDATRQLINYVYNIVGIPAGEEEERSERAEESSDTTPEEEERSEYTEENSDSIPEEEEERSEYTGEYSDTSE